MEIKTSVASSWHFISTYLHSSFPKTRAGNSRKTTRCLSLLFFIPINLMSPLTPNIFFSFIPFFSFTFLFSFVFPYFFHLLTLNIYVPFINGTLLVLKTWIKKLSSRYRRLFPGGNPPGCKTAHTCRADVKNEWSCKSTPPCALMKHTLTNLTLPFVVQKMFCKC